MTALECAPARREQSTDSRLLFDFCCSASRGEMATTADAGAAVVGAFEISDGLLPLLRCGGGCGELGRGASIAARAVNAGRPWRVGRGAAARRARDGAAANCCEGGFGFFFFRASKEEEGRGDVRRDSETRLFRAGPGTFPAFAASEEQAPSPLRRGGA